MEAPEQDPNQINIELSEELAEGVYCNLAMIAHSNTEFVLDFIRLMPGVNKAKVKSRVVMTPEHTIRFVEALQENLRRFQDAFGEIPQNRADASIPFNFGGPAGMA